MIIKNVCQNQIQGTTLSCLTTLPIPDVGLGLRLTRIRYGWVLTRLPTNCQYGARFDLQHFVLCKRSGFISIRHNRIRNITGRPLKEMCKDIRVVPQLIQLTDETLQLSILTRNKVCLDICTRGFGQTGQMTFFDVRFFNKNIKRYENQDI